MVATTKTLLFTEREKSSPVVKVNSAAAAQTLPLSITQPKTITKNAQTKPVFSNNLTYYLKGNNGHGGGARPSGNSRAVAIRT